MEDELRTDNQDEPGPPAASTGPHPAAALPPSEPAGEAAAEEPCGPVATSPPILVPSHLPRRRWRCDLLLDFPRFIDGCLSRPRPPLFLLVAWLAGMAAVIDVMENKALFMRRYPAADWPRLWLFIALAGLIAGATMYWAAGAWYQLRVRLSGGRPDGPLARRICLYAGIPAALAVILVEVVHMAVYGSRYFTRPRLAGLETAGMTLIALAIGFAIWRGFQAARAVLATAPVRSVLLLIALPLYGILATFAATVTVDMVRQTEARQMIATASRKADAGDSYGAEKTLRRALDRLTPEESALRLQAGNRLGLACGSHGDPAGAVAGYHIALAAAEPGGADYFATLGKIRLQEKRAPEAVNCFERALRLDPENLTAHNSLGLLFLGEFDGVAADYPRALRHNLKAHQLAHDPDTAYNLAETYFHLQRWADALPLYDGLYRTRPPSRDVRYQLGICCHMLGQEEQADRLLTHADYNRRGVTLWQEEDYEGAEQCLRRALTLAPAEATAARILYLSNLAVILKDHDNPPASIACYREALALSTPGSAQHYQLQGSLFLAEHNTRKAIAAFDRCLAVDPDNIKAHQNLGLIYLGDADRLTVDYRLALTHNEKAYAMHKSTETAWNLARNYYALDRDYEALALFEQILADDPDDADAHYYTGMVCYDLGDLNGAQQHLSRAIALDPSLKDDEVEEILGETLGRVQQKKT
jgi:tetratricopeptide (TPR) repeat protein